MHNNFHIRQTGLIDPTKLTQDIGIVGAGSIGGWTALALLKMGCPKVTVYDFDKVEEQNVGPQLYKASDIGLLKTDALKNRIEAVVEASPVTVNTMVDEHTVFNHDVLIGGVDTMKARQNIATAVKNSPRVRYFIDGRMAAHEIQIYSFETKCVECWADYNKTLFKEEDETPVACSMRSVIYNCFIIGGLMADLVAHLANGQKLPFNLEADLTNFTLYGGF